MSGDSPGIVRVSLDQAVTAGDHPFAMAGNCLGIAVTAGDYCPLNL